MAWDKMHCPVQERYHRKNRFLSRVRLVKDAIYERVQHEASF